MTYFKIFEVKNVSTRPNTAFPTFPDISEKEFHGNNEQRPSLLFHRFYTVNNVVSSRKYYIFRLRNERRLCEQKAVSVIKIILL